jgi:hypothetical protein
MMTNEGGLICLIIYCYIYHTLPALIPLYEHELIPAVVVHAVFQVVLNPVVLLGSVELFQ